MLLQNINILLAELKMSNNTDISPIIIILYSYRLVVETGDAS